MTRWGVSVGWLLKNRFQSQAQPRQPGDYSKRATIHQAAAGISTGLRGELTGGFPDSTEHQRNSRCFSATWPMKGIALYGTGHSHRASSPLRRLPDNRRRPSLRDRSETRGGGGVTSDAGAPTRRQFSFRHNKARHSPGTTTQRMKSNLQPRYKLFFPVVSASSLLDL